MNNQKIVKFMFVLVPALLVLTIWWNAFAPFLSIALIYLILLVIRSGFMSTLLGKRHEPKVYYQPHRQPPTPNLPLRANPPLGFDLTDQEYKLLSQKYQQGYQAPVLQHPSKTHESPMPKQDHPFDYEQPQSQYPQSEPPLQY